MTGETKLKACLIISIFLLVIACTAAAGRTIYVDNYGTGDFNTIQAAINDANDGDTIIVGDGTYTGDGNRDIEFLGKAIVLCSKNGPENCIIDCNGTEAEPHRGFYFHDGEDANSVLDGFTITNGNLAGGGIRCYAVSPTIRNCIITKNTGGGICCIACYGVTVTNSLITENLGGGINCNFGMMGIGFNDIIVTNCTFSANMAECGGAVYIGEGSNPSIVNCILWGDTAPHGAEIAMTRFDWGSQLSICFSNVQGGEAAVFDRCFLRWGPGNIDADPCFADPCNSDYHLKSQAGRWDPNSQSWAQDDMTSPCIDAGNPMSPIGSEPFPNGGIINMGAHGGTYEASKSYFGGPVCETIVAGDLNGDCKVNFLDFRLMALHWLGCTVPVCETIVEVSAETDKSTYLLGKEVTVFVTAYNPNPEPVTLYFGSSLVASYLMDGVFDWSEWQLFTPSLLQFTIEPYNSLRRPLSHGSYEMEIYPLDVGTHTVVGEVVGYGCSAPVEFEVVAE